MSLYKDLGIEANKPKEANDKRFVKCKRTGFVYLRPYEPGESLAGIFVQTGKLPEEGDLIAMEDGDQWLMRREYANRNYVLPPSWPETDPV